MTEDIQTSKDYLHVGDDKTVLDLMKRTSKLAGGGSSENDHIVFSDFVLKYNKFTRSQKRGLVLSTSCMFNYVPKGNGVGKCKRVIPLKSIEQLSTTEHGQDILIHIPSEYDVYIRSPRKEELVEIIEKYVGLVKSVDEHFHNVVPVPSLDKYVLSKREAKRGLHLIKAPKISFEEKEGGEEEAQEGEGASEKAEDVAKEIAEAKDEDGSKGGGVQRARKESTFFGVHMDAASIFKTVDGRETVDSDAVFANFLRRARMTHADAEKLIRMALSIMQEEPNIVEIESPVTVTGDIHGQFFDLQNTFSLGGSPEKRRYVFLGDFVDRGKFGTEVILFMFALKVAHPRDVVLLRGNHEARRVTKWYNFKDECLLKYNADLYDLFMDSFDTLPLAAIIDKKFFCVHGGLSPHAAKLSDIYRVDRFREPPENGLITDLLWSDPEEERPILDHYSHLEIMDLEKTRENIRSTRSLSAECSTSLNSALLDEDDKGLNSDPNSSEPVGRPRARSFWVASSSKGESELGEGFQKNGKRGCSVTYGFAAVKNFLEENNLKCVIRAHEVEAEGYRVFRKLDGSDYPSVITIFSAPNYCNAHGNRAAVLKVDGEDVCILQYVQAPQPTLASEINANHADEHEDAQSEWSTDTEGEMVVEPVEGVEEDSEESEEEKTEGVKETDVEVGVRMSVGDAEDESRKMSEGSDFTAEKEDKEKDDK
uniref:Serine/threonine-protein phosphatase n=1 Tax=Palpitomonas bilix TaxID=652834 RepID=A0A7S3GA66_9EUKA|mmetsp:Transcript_34628/g.89811  ORF Transcript_34628/g.89811 Transcript_34628/m.89811 type:complete len:708 (+) Transcript_34628:325-2448(+)|eukprot:CAMPEP_0113898882 /NCGR_PEP_ID=MMETSP0780_2-20120614/19674_1 /TAXON_ID=652834 /ORGANISM="Palpitomonas bilix" /LENGTH=707 /DNA_ID=CAMNT_0000890891 /DNA_START=302 /DNA_END=2425 /DNA_ORIENTATION=- /assembly_acc=CAM_ASM_000599